MRPPLHMLEERLDRQTAPQTPLCYILCHVTSKFITLTHCPQLLWKTRMNQINIEEALRSGGLSVSPMDSAGEEERVINKVPLHMLYILQSLMISSVFP